MAKIENNIQYEWAVKRVEELLPLVTLYKCQKKTVIFAQKENFLVKQFNKKKILMNMKKDLNLLKRNR